MPRRGALDPVEENLIREYVVRERGVIVDKLQFQVVKGHQGVVRRPAVRGVYHVCVFVGAYSLHIGKPLFWVFITLCVELRPWSFQKLPMG